MLELYQPQSIRYENMKTRAATPCFQNPYLLGAIVGYTAFSEMIFEPNDQSKLSRIHLQIFRRIYGNMDRFLVGWVHCRRKCIDTFVYTSLFLTSETGKYQGYQSKSRAADVNANGIAGERVLEKVNCVLRLSV